MASESASSTRTVSRGTPSASAVSVATNVVVPWPWSVTPDATRTLPSGWISMEHDSCPIQWAEAPWWVGETPSNNTA